jgi:hypothetical protein
MRGRRALMSTGALHIAVSGPRIVATLALTLAFVSDVDVAFGGPTPSCRITNVTTQQAYSGSGSNLQDAIDEASGGTKLRVRGRCVGTFTISKDLTLIGVSTSASPTPTLDGNLGGTVLRVSAGHVALTDLAITRGRAEDGSGGGVNNGGTVDLFGTTSVLKNGAERGAGVFNAGGATFRLHGSSSVSGNDAVFAGGGIYNLGTVRLEDRAHVSENLNSEPDYLDGGGIYNLGVLSLRDASSVWGNRAGEDGCFGCGGSTGGGGVLNEGTMTMRNRSSVRANTTFSETPGGGIANVGDLRMYGASSVRHNSVTDANGGGITNAGTITLNGTSSVRWNTALNGHGGGIFSSGTLIGVVEGRNVSNNAPDDVAP